MESQSFYSEEYTQKISRLYERQAQLFQSEKSLFKTLMNFLLPSNIEALV